MKILLATSNRGKLREIQHFFRDTGLEFISLRDAGVPPAEETGTTFAENAALKATAAAQASGLWAIGEDSGLVVPALGGRPGIYSARYAGPDASDADNNAKLLEDMADLSSEERRASFFCVMVLSSPQGQTYTVEGRCDGEILLTPRGEGGFGYDPLFYVPQLKRTFAEMSTDEKERWSHRGDALRKLHQLLDRIKFLS